MPALLGGTPGHPDWAAHPVARCAIALRSSRRRRTARRGRSCRRGSPAAPQPRPPRDRRHGPVDHPTHPVAAGDGGRVSTTSRRAGTRRRLRGRRGGPGRFEPSAELPEAPPLTLRTDLRTMAHVVAVALTPEQAQAAGSLKITDNKVAARRLLSCSGVGLNAAAVLTRGAPARGGGAHGCADVTPARTYGADDRTGRHDRLVQAILDASAEARASTPGRRRPPFASTPTAPYNTRRMR